MPYSQIVTCQRAAHYVNCARSQGVCLPCDFVPALGGCACMGTVLLMASLFFQATTMKFLVALAFTIGFLGVGALKISSTVGDGSIFTHRQVFAKGSNVDVKIQCNDPDGEEVMWEKDGEELPCPGEVCTEEGKNQKELVLSGSLDSRKGNYTCRLKDDEDTQEKFYVFDKDSEIEFGINQAVTIAELKESREHKEVKYLRLRLGCKFSNEGERQSLDWYVNGEYKDTADSGRTKKWTSYSNGSLVVLQVEESDLGSAYMCVVTDKAQKVYRSYAIVDGPAAVVKDHVKSLSVIEEDEAELTCNFVGFPQPKVAWKRTNEGESEKLDLDNKRMFVGSYENIDGAMLRITNAQYEDRGDYVCYAESDSAQNKTITLRVKDKLAALWPFLGIVAEVVALVVIIFFYEQRQKRKHDDEDSDEANDCVAGLTASADNIRQRKV